MGPGYRTILYFCTCLSNIAALRLSLPNNSLSILSGNQTLESWPRRLPWTWAVSEDLSMQIDYCGNYVPPSKLQEARGGLDDIIRQIESKANWMESHSDWRRFFSDSFSVVFCLDHHFGRPIAQRLSMVEAVQFVLAIKDHFFIRKDKLIPRDFRAEMKKGDWYMGFIYFDYKELKSYWPTKLPSDLFIWNRDMELYLYGRDGEPPSTASVLKSLDNLAQAVHDEGPQSGSVSSRSLIRGPLKIDFEDLTQDDDSIHMTRNDQWIIVDYTRRLFQSRFYKPREFGAHIKVANRVVANFYITFLDPDEVDIA